MRIKNALRGHFIGIYNPEQPSTKPTEWLELAKWITNISDDSDEETDDQGFYDGDGTKETTVIGISEAYTFEGYYDAKDKAQKMVADMKRTIGDSRKVWHKIIVSDKTEEWVGVATVSEIVCGGGDATDYEEFKCKITYNQMPAKGTPEI